MDKNNNVVITLPTGKTVTVRPTFNKEFGAIEYNTKSAFKEQAPGWFSWWRFRLGLQEKMMFKRIGEHGNVAKPAGANE